MRVRMCVRTVGEISLTELKLHRLLANALHVHAFAFCRSKADLNSTFCGGNMKCTSDLNVGFRGENMKYI
jgi:hypothetical protein